MLLFVGLILCATVFAREDSLRNELEAVILEELLADESLSQGATVSAREDSLRNELEAVILEELLADDSLSQDATVSAPEIPLTNELEAVILEDQLADESDSQACPQNEVDYSGGDIDFEITDTWEECGMKCEKKEGCFVYTYRKSDKKCHLKNEGAKSRKHKLSGHISGLKTCSVSSACPQHEVDYSGGDNWFGNTDTWEQCGRKCDETPECHVWTYRKSDKRCHTKNENAKASRHTLSGHISGAKGCPASSATCPQNDIDYSGGDTWSGMTHTWRDCGQKCEKRADCVVWTYRKSDKKCHTKNAGAKSRKHKLSGHISGLKHCPGCQSRETSYHGKNNWWGTTNNWQECGKKCNARGASACDTWTYRESDKMCYHKALYDLTGIQTTIGHISGGRECPV